MQLRFFMLFGCPTTNPGPLSRGQAHSPDVNYCVIPSFDPKATRNLVTRLCPLSPAVSLASVEPGTFRFYHNALTC